MPLFGRGGREPLVDKETHNVQAMNTDAECLRAVPTSIKEGDLWSEWRDCIGWPKSAKPGRERASSPADRSMLFCASSRPLNHGKVWVLFGLIVIPFGCNVEDATPPLFLEEPSEQTLGEVVYGMTCQMVVQNERPTDARGRRANARGHRALAREGRRARWRRAGRALPGWCRRSS